MQQLSREWFEARRGIITGSRFGDVLARPTTKRRRWYVDELVAERRGAATLDDQLNPPWMAPGREYEAEARRRYEWEHDTEVTEAGLFRARGLPIAVSPDGLIGDDGGCEIKVRTSAKSHLKTKKVGIDPVYKPQVQGCLWITGREWWDFISYYRSPTTLQRDLHVHRVYPDKAYHLKLARACRDLMREVRGLLK